MITPGSVIGIIGGGQLGRMTALAASELGYKVHILSDHEHSPASQVAYKTTVAAFDDEQAIREFSKNVDVVTLEFENIPHETIQTIEKNAKVHPGWKVLHTAQNRIREKDFLNSVGVGTAPYKAVTNLTELKLAYAEIGPTCILKTCELGYDGKGQVTIKSEKDLESAWESIKSTDTVLEGMVQFDKEISVVAARGEDGEFVPFIPVENIHKNGILDTTIAPAAVDFLVINNAWQMTEKIAQELDLIGVIAVEMFLTKTGKILVNEIAPRPHNSGHWTMDACITCQFEQLVRAVCGLPLGCADFLSNAVMKNLIGDDIELWREFISSPDSKIHIYGKKEIRPGRKMGHITHIITPEEDDEENFLNP